MRTILVPFCNDDAAEVALNTAWLIAKKTSGHIEGLHIWRAPQVIAGEGVVFPSESLIKLTEEGKNFSLLARERFNQLMEQNDIELCDITVSADKATCSWREGEGSEAEVVGDYGRLFDLIVVGRATTCTTSDWKTNVEAALFESGRPVVIAGTKAPESFFRKILIAWNGATETAKAIAASMPILQYADEICVLTIEGGTVKGPTEKEVTAHLRRNGLNARSEKCSKGTESIGDVILKNAVSYNADLLIKGAFTNSRLRQLIFGGATRDVIEKSPIPALLAH